MTIAAATRATAAHELSAWPWFVALGGFVVMFVPSYWQASHGFWQRDEFGHAPLILAIAAWLMWQRRREIQAAATPPPMLAFGALFVLASVAYIVGRGVSMASVEFVSQWLIVGCVLLLLGGTGSLKAAWFPWLYLLFMVPLPATFVDAITGPLKAAISTLVVDGLHGLNYPIARAGVMISIGPYQLLVADACSGLNSMFSLAALGTLFIHLVAGQRTLRHRIVLVAAIVPIAFAANVIRVIALVLVTYHLGDDAGQGFLHGAAGLVLMGVSLLAFVGLDRALTWWCPTGTQAAKTLPRATRLDAT